MIIEQKNRCWHGKAEMWVSSLTVVCLVLNDSEEQQEDEVCILSVQSLFC